MPKEFEMAERTSNKQIADKLDTLIGLMVAQAERDTEAAPLPVLTNEVTEPVAAPTSIKVDAAYKAHQEGKSQEHADTKGVEVVLYARKNKLGETKLAYALRSRYDEVVSKQPSHLGPVASFQPKAVAA